MTEAPRTQSSKTPLILMYLAGVTWIPALLLGQFLPGEWIGDSPVLLINLAVFGLLWITFRPTGDFRERAIAAADTHLTVAIVAYFGFFTVIGFPLIFAALGASLFYAIRGSMHASKEAPYRPKLAIRWTTKPALLGLLGVPLLAAGTAVGLMQPTQICVNEGLQNLGLALIGAPISGAIFTLYIARVNSWTLGRSIAVTIGSGTISAALVIIIWFFSSLLAIACV